jgi:hypothetical protein
MAKTTTTPRVAAITSPLGYTRYRYRFEGAEEERPKLKWVMDVPDLARELYDYLVPEEQTLYRTVSRGWNYVFRLHLRFVCGIISKPSETKEEKKRTRAEEEVLKRKKKQREEAIALADYLLSERSVRMCTWAAGKNYLDVLQYACTHRYPFHALDALAHASTYGALATFKWIVDTFPQNIPFGLFTQYLENAAENGKLDIIEWLHSNGHTLTHSMVERSIEGGHLPVVQYLFKNLSIWPDTIVIQAAKSGHLHIIKWLATIYDFTHYRMSWKLAVHHATGYGHQPILEFLFDKFRLYPTDLSYVIRDYPCCPLSSNLTFLQWLCRWRPCESIRNLLNCLIINAPSISSDCLEYLIRNYPEIHRLNFEHLIRMVGYDTVYDILKRINMLSLMPTNALSLKKEEEGEEEEEEEEDDDEEEEVGFDDPIHTNEGSPSDNDEDEEEEEEEENAGHVPKRRRI